MTNSREERFSAGPELPRRIAKATAGPGGERLLALVSDLMLASRLEEAAGTIGLLLRTVDAVTSLEAGLREHSPDLVLLDLADAAFPFRPTLMLLQTHVPRPVVLAFFPHVRKELGEMARTAGCELVLPRSRLLLDLPASLREGLAMRSANRS